LDSLVVNGLIYFMVGSSTVMHLFVSETWYLFFLPPLRLLFLLFWKKPLNDGLAYIYNTSISFNDSAAWSSFKYVLRWDGVVVFPPQRCLFLQHFSVARFGVRSDHLCVHVYW
jgi:hypothetical protein